MSELKPEEIVEMIRELVKKERHSAVIEAVQRIKGGYTIAAIFDLLKADNLSELEINAFRSGIDKV